MSRSAASEELEDLDRGWDVAPASDVRVRGAVDRDLVDLADAEDDEHATKASPVIGELARIGDPSSVPRKLRRQIGRILPPEGSLLWSRIDGEASIAEILAGCALPEADALRVLVLLVKEGCVTFLDAAAE